jgi:hypothetical protein
MIVLSIQATRIVACRVRPAEANLPVTDIVQVPLALPLTFAQPKDDTFRTALEQALAGIAPDRQESIVAVLPNSLVLLAEVDGDVGAGTDTARYAAEEQFPVDLEQLETTVLPTETGRTMVAACPTWLLDAVDQAAQAHRMPIACYTSELSPLMAVASPENAAVFLAHADDPRCWVACDCGREDLKILSITIDDGQVRATCGDILQHNDEDNGECRVMICAPPERSDILTNSLREVRPDLETVTPDQNAEATDRTAIEPDVLQPMLAAARALRDNIKLPIRFRTQALGRAQRSRLLARPAQVAGWLLALAFGLGAAGLYLDAHDAAEASQRAGQQQVALYQEVFGSDSPPPASVLMWMQSEKTRLTGISGQAAGRPVYRSALDSLQQMARRLPTDLRFNIQRVRIGQEELTVSGAVLNHSGAQQIQRTLEAVEAFAARPPRTKQLQTEGVSFAISATITGGTP